MSSSLEQQAQELIDISERLSIIAYDIGNSGSFLLQGDSSQWAVMLVIFVLSCFIGYFVVWNVTPALHAPLMSVTNAISSVIIVGGLLAVSSDSPWDWVGLIAIFIASINIFGGFLVSHRMLSMFKAKKKTK